MKKRMDGKMRKLKIFKSSTYFALGNYDANTEVPLEEQRQTWMEARDKEGFDVEILDINVAVGGDKNRTVELAAIIYTESKRS